MTTNELIRTLRLWADKMTKSGKRTLVYQAADRLEELDERVAILQVDTDPCRNCQEFVCDNCQYAKKRDTYE